MDERRQVRVAGVLVAAGRGARFGAELPKQFRSLGGRPLYEHAACALHESPVVYELYVVVPPGREESVRLQLESAGIGHKLQAVVAGGATRQESVWRGLEAIEASTHVLVHDAARPFLTERLIQAVVSASERHGAATVGLPVSDTLFRAEAGEPETEPSGAHVVAPIARDGVWSVQTPQVFELELLREAHRRFRGRDVDATDDGTLVLELGQRLELVRGSWWNIKVTRPEDLRRAEAILAMRDQLLAAEEMS